MSRLLSVVAVSLAIVGASLALSHSLWAVVLPVVLAAALELVRLATSFEKKWNWEKFFWFLCLAGVVILVRQLF